jgi:Flp pilus assembly protein TadG
MKKNLFGRAGQAIVEFALVVTVFFMVLFATIDMGFYIYSLTILDMAVRDAVRTSVTFSDWSTNYDSRLSQIKDIVVERAALLPTSVQSELRSKIYMSFDPTSTAPEAITVEVRQQPFKGFSGFWGVVLPTKISTQATMRYEH